MAIYDAKPSMYEANGNGSYTYRWNITEVEVSAGHETDATVKKWQCDEVVVWGTVTKDKITETVVISLWDNDYEKKLINDYNAAKEGLFDADNQLYIDKYKDFLSQRKAVKEQVTADCETLNIY